MMSAEQPLLNKVKNKIDDAYLTAVKAELAIFDIQEAITADYAEGEHPYRMASASAAALGAVALNLTKAPLIAVPAATLWMAEYTDSPLAAGLTTALVYGAWTHGTTAAVSGALGQHPNLKSTVYERSNGKIDALPAILPNFEAHFAGKPILPDKSIPLRTRMYRFFEEHVRVGTTVVGVGANPYVLAAQLTEKPKPEITTLRRKLAVDGAVFMGALTCGVAVSVDQLKDSHPMIAAQIENQATDSTKLTAIALLLMAGQGVKKWRSKRRDKKLQEELESTQDLDAELTSQTLDPVK